MKIRMKVGISGGRADGRPWPMPGEGDDTLVVGDREGMELCAAGLAVPVTDDEDEPETRPDKAAAEKRDAPAPGFDVINASGVAVAAAAQDAARATSGKSAAATTVTPAAMSPKAASPASSAPSRK